MQFPPQLAQALNVLLEGVSRKDLAREAQTLSAGYRGGASSQAIATPLQAMAYAVARMPATYAACAAVFDRVKTVMPGFAPASLLDVGAGSGAASWAAAAAWPGLAAVTMLDRNPALRDLARALAGALPGVEILCGELGGERPNADLVVASYVLAELPEDRAAAIAADLWKSAGLALALIEPGTPSGFVRIRNARAALIEAGAHLAAPCTHHNPCPMRDGDWCHFSQRLPRSRDHMLLKDAQVPFEDERYSYLVVARAKVASGARILSVPLDDKPGMTFKLCGESGLRAQFVARRDKDTFRRVRKKGWGDLF